MEQEQTGQQNQFEGQSQSSVKPAVSAELKLRVASAVILMPLVVAAIFYGGVLFSALVVLAAILMAFEWKNIITPKDFDESGKGWEILGLCYIAIPCAALVWLRNIDVEFYGISGLAATLWAFALVWAVDSAAYFTGKKWGNKKLLPSISPNKTWVGLFGGIAAAAIVGLAVSLSLKGANILLVMALSAVLAVVEQAGDFFESWVKRQFDVKDSGSIIPGHGGLLDRVDGLMAVAPAILIILLATSGQGIFR